MKTRSNEYPPKLLSTSFLPSKVSSVSNCEVVNHSSKSQLAKSKPSSKCSCAFANVSRSLLSSSANVSSGPTRALESASKSFFRMAKRRSAISVCEWPASNRN